jgi:carotenoid cleavage dioxygenase-like enzyme
MAHFPDTPIFIGFSTPPRIEADIVDLVRPGTIPDELNGPFYRVQPDAQFPRRLAGDIAFSGAGIIGRFNFRDGQFDVRPRWGRTETRRLERAAGSALFGAHRNPLTDDELVNGRIRGTVNTNAWIHGAQLCALNEDSPTLVTVPVTMETEGTLGSVAR